MRYAIIGAGLAGLTAAVEIHRREPGAHIDVYEAADRIGAKLFTAPFESGPTDVGAEAFLARNSEAREFFDSLGLADSIVYPSGLASALYSGGELQLLPRETIMGIPGTSGPVAHLVSGETAVRIDAEEAAEPLNWVVGEDRSVGELVRQRYGDEIADRTVSALLGGVYSCGADDLGVRATIPALAEALDQLVMSNKHTTLSAAIKVMLSARPAPVGEPQPVFGAFRGGYAELYEALAEESGADIYLDAFVSGVAHTPEGFQVTGGEEGTYDKVLLATPAPTTALLLKSLAPDASQTLKSVKLANSVVVAMKFDSDQGLPEHSGVLIAADEPDLHAKAFTFSSRKWPHLAERGGALVRASFGRFGDQIALTTDEDTLVDWALDDLQTVTGFDGREAGLSEILTQRWFGGLPRYDADHVATVDKFRSQLATVPGVEAAGAWAEGVGVPAVIADARAAAARLLGDTPASGPYNEKS